MRQASYMFCALLLFAMPLGAAHAAETLDEKIYDPGQTAPGQSVPRQTAPSQRPPAVGTPAPSPDVLVTPGQAGPSLTAPGSAGGDTIIVIPDTQRQTVPGQIQPEQTVPGQSLPGQAVPDGSIPRVLVPENVSPSAPADSVLPSTLRPDAEQKEKPTIVTPPSAPVPVPELPKAPDAKKRDIIVTPAQPAQPLQPAQPDPSRQPDKSGKSGKSGNLGAEERVILTPADFLPTTPNKPAPKQDMKPAPKADTPALPGKDKAPSPKGEPQKTAPKPEKAEAKPHPQKDDKPAPKKDAKPDPQKDAPPNSPKDKPKDTPKDSPKDSKDKPTAAKKKGDIMHIPPDAAKKGDLSFLEGCWKGLTSGNDKDAQRNDRATRICFDAKGNGKNSVTEPGKQEPCVGSAKGVMSGDNLLRVDFDKAQCPSGKTWKPQGDGYMTCRDAGTGADCFLYFNGEPKLRSRFYRD